jgi:hypothetical protein
MDKSPRDQWQSSKRTFHPSFSRVKVKGIFLGEELINPKFFQWLQPGINRLVLTLAGFPVQILSALRAQSPASFPAYCLLGDGQQNLVLYRRG